MNTIARLFVRGKGIKRRNKANKRKVRYPAWFVCYE